LAIGELIGYLPIADFRIIRELRMGELDWRSGLIETADMPRSIPE
jgi:hypothetical protein